MRKLYFTLFLFLVCAVAANAGPVTVEQAKQTALRHILGKTTRMYGNGKTADNTVTLTLAKTATQASAGDTGTPLYYIFNREGDAGMIVVAGDDRMRPILAYTEKGRYSDTDVSPALAWWLDAIAKTAESVAQGTATQAYIQAKAATGKAVTPLIQTQWNQGEPYNLLCPDDNAHGGKSVTGCVATAMAQIMYYWRYPERGKGTVKYTTVTHGWNFNENLENYPFEYDKMLPYYAGGESAEAQMAVARLMYACGVAVGMDYCYYGSGGGVTPEILTNHFGYDKACVAYYRQDFTVAEWDNIIRTELDNGRPVLYSGSSMSVGHLFICDGYDSDGLYHINWGWSGAYDGWFDLTSLVPTGIPGEGYNIGQNIICGIQPDTGAPQPAKETYFTYESLTANMTIAYVTGGEIPLTINKLYTINGKFEGYFGVALYDESGNPVAGQCSVQTSLEENYGFNEWKFNFKLPLNLPDGTYAMRPVYGLTQDDYKPMVPSSSNSDAYIVVKVSNGIVFLSAPEPITYELSITSGTEVNGGSAYAGHTADITFNIKNSGPEFNQIVYLRDKSDGQMLFFDNFVIEEGETKAMTARILIPDNTVKEEIDVYYNDPVSGQESIIGTLNFDVSIPAEGAPMLTLDDMQLITPEVAHDGEVVYTATISNSGGFYDNDLAALLSINGMQMYEYRDFAINKGETKTLTISMEIDWFLDYVGVKEGNGEVSLGYFNDDVEIVEFERRLPFKIVETSGIANVETEKKPLRIYSINGLYMGTDATKLPKGIYIRGGKKFVVR